MQLHTDVISNFSLKEGVYMSDLLLKGKNPSKEEGKEYFLHCMDWWWDIVSVMVILLGGDVVEEAFYKDSWLTPPTPHFDADDAVFFAQVLEAATTPTRRVAALRDMYRSDPNIDWSDEDIDSVSEERDQQIQDFIAFLKSCGGCYAHWHGMTDESN